jgi:hypothetical protein
MRSREAAKGNENADFCIKFILKSLKLTQVSDQAFF